MISIRVVVRVCIGINVNRVWVKVMVVCLLDRLVGF